MHRVRRLLRSIWTTAVDGLLALGAYHGAMPPADLAAVLGTGRHPCETGPDFPAPGREAARTGADALLTPAERHAWNQLIERF
ncbi:MULTISPECIES: hypothetical protein [Streptomyces]|uniref:hypothetical protein n=1 Tax=Streptomyces TaxID=1883 RepID=UPI00166FA359|nr:MULTISPECIES: hypothetical protein [Streptomyces]UFR01358.1 hypothetical protein KBP30_09285 [Streptomyces sp. Go40/10]GGS91624.1 hypothetical protein GCM10010206_63010 [Streptomyces cinerochromogenes]